MNILEKTNVYLELIKDNDFAHGEIIFANKGAEISPCLFIKQIDETKIEYLNLKSCSLEEIENNCFYRMKYINYCQND